jgi:predicted MFS family arabinose efflux permease
MRLLRYAVAAVLVRLADEGARIALVLLALERTDSAAAGGAMVAALLVPHVVAAPAMGALADRARRPSVVIAAAAVGMGAALAVTATAVGRVPLPLVLVVLLAGGSCGPALTGALTSLLADLTGPDRLPRAYGMDALTYGVAGIAGAPLAAVLAGTVGAAPATFALAGSSAAGGLLIATLPGSVRHAPVPVGLLGGARAIVRDRVLGAVTGATTLGQFGLGALPVVVVVLADRAGTPETAGLLLGVLSAGGLVGSLLWTWRPARPERAAAVVMASLLGVGVPLVAAALTPSLPARLVLFAVSGLFDGPLLGALLTARQRHAPAAVRAQVFTLGAGAKITAAAAGAALAGAAAGLPGAVQLALAGTPAVLAGLLGTHTLRHRSAAPTLVASADVSSQD